VSASPGRTSTLVDVVESSTCAKSPPVLPPKQILRPPTKTKGFHPTVQFDRRDPHRTVRTPGFHKIVETMSRGSERVASVQRGAPLCSYVKPGNTLSFFLPSASQNTEELFRPKQEMRSAVMTHPFNSNIEVFGVTPRSEQDEYEAEQAGALFRAFRVNFAFAGPVSASCVKDARTSRRSAVSCIGSKHSGSRPGSANSVRSAASTESATSVESSVSLMSAASGMTSGSKRSRASRKVRKQQNSTQLASRIKLSQMMFMSQEAPTYDVGARTNELRAKLDGLCCIPTPTTQTGSSAGSEGSLLENHRGDHTVSASVVQKANGYQTMSDVSALHLHPAPDVLSRQNGCYANAPCKNSRCCLQQPSLTHGNGYEHRVDQASESLKLHMTPSRTSHATRSPIAGACPPFQQKSRVRVRPLVRSCYTLPSGMQCVSTRASRSCHAAEATTRTLVQRLRDISTMISEHDKKLTSSLYTRDLHWHQELPLKFESLVPGAHVVAGRCANLPSEALPYQLWLRSKRHDRMDGPLSDRARSSVRSSGHAYPSSASANKQVAGCRCVSDDHRSDEQERSLQGSQNIDVRSSCIQYRDALTEVLAMRHRVLARQRGKLAEAVRLHAWLRPTLQKLASDAHKHGGCPRCVLRFLATIHRKLVAGAVVDRPTVFAMLNNAFKPGDWKVKALEIIVPSLCDALRVSMDNLQAWFKENDIDYPHALLRAVKKKLGRSRSHHAGASGGAKHKMHNRLPPHSCAGGRSAAPLTPGLSALDEGHAAHAASASQLQGSYPGSDTTAASRAA